jgi:photosystem II stability/assembly factor-like uncharacterized protein
MTDDEFRDDFGDELVDALNIRARDGASMDTAVAVRRRARFIRTRRVLTAAAVVALAVAVGAAIATSRQEPNHVSVATPSSSTTTIPASFQPLESGVQDWTWVSKDQGWAFVRKPCGTSVCVALRETTDGGRTWESLPAPDALNYPAQYDPDVACTRRACVSSVRFATSKIGWLFGPALFRTSDGGHTWTRETSALVLDVEASHGVAMRLTTTNRDCGGGCEYRIDRSHLPSSSWQRVPSGPEYAFPHLLLQETDAYDVNTANGAGAGEAYLQHSGNGGTTWTKIKDPCAQPRRFARTASASAAPGGVLAVLCELYPGSGSSVQVSTDRGETFGPRHAIPGTLMATGPIAAATGNTIAAAYSDPHSYGVLVSHDGGITWARTLELRRPLSSTNSFDAVLGWQNDRTARVSFNTNAIWTTRDGGRTWTENRVAP